MKRKSTNVIASAIIVLVVVILWVGNALAQTLPAPPLMNLDPFLNLLALALVIERILEIAVTLIPGIEEGKEKVKDKPDELAKLQRKIKRYTLAIGMVIGVVACLLAKFGILDEIFPDRMSPFNAFNHVITGIIAGSGADPVHHMILLLVGIRDKLKR